MREAKLQISAGLLKKRVRTLGKTTQAIHFETGCKGRKEQRKKYSGRIRSRLLFSGYFVFTAGFLQPYLAQLTHL